MPAMTWRGCGSPTSTMSLSSLSLFGTRSAVMVGDRITDAEAAHAHGLPLVVVDVMRVGPSTGIATKSEQSDLNIAVYGLHGDAPHVVVAANSVADCLFTTQWAVHLAEALQYRPKRMLY